MKECTNPYMFAIRDLQIAIVVLRNEVLLLQCGAERSDHFIGFVVTIDHNNNGRDVREESEILSNSIDNGSVTDTVVVSIDRHASPRNVNSQHGVTAYKN